MLKKKKASKAMLYIEILSLAMDGDVMKMKKKKIDQNLQTIRSVYTLF